jgi:hypothetical protein
MVGLRPLGPAQALTGWTIGLPVSKQQLIHKGRELDDDDNLVIDAGVIPDSKLHVIAKLSLEDRTLRRLKVC